MGAAYATNAAAGRAPRYSRSVGVADGWVELGDRFFVRRYAFYDQNIGVVLGDGEAMVIDTRSTFVQAREILDDLRELTRDPVTVVVDTHGHFDHAYGNHVFRPAAIWGHRRCVSFIERTGEARRARIALDEPDLAADLEEVIIDPPDHVFDERVTFEIGGREVELRFLGRGHTDHDIVISVPGTDVVWAGDLLENGAVPFFGDGYPLDWPATVAAMLPLIGDGIVVPGHGDHAGMAFARAQADGFASLAALARRVNGGELDLEDALRESTTFDDHHGDGLREPLRRAIAQLRSELD
jgi:glyoxylase-like metal-dependent hydrolase (beta-lactamase superfamily II)